jgi:beta propeller repeat protein
MKKNTLIRPIFSLAFVCFPIFLYAAPYTEFAISTITDDQTDPVIDGNTVVWQDHFYGDWDIVGADISNTAAPVEFDIAAYENQQQSPAIYHSTVVYQDNNDFGDWDTRLADISDRSAVQRYAITPYDANQTAVAVFGSMAVWQDDYSGIEVWGAAVIDPCMPVTFDAVPYVGYAPQKPAIYGQIVVWQHYDSTYQDWDIYGSDLSDPRDPIVFGISLMTGNQTVPAVSGTTAAWQDSYGTNDDIYGADISDTAHVKEFAICTNASSQQSPAISGNIVVWQDKRSGNWDIYAYNLLTKKEFRLTDNTADQTSPAISGGIVVWQDKRSGNWDIYGAKLSGAILATCPLPLAGDIDGNCKVNFADYAQLAAQWLVCNIEPKTSCL